MQIGVDAVVVASADYVDLSVGRVGRCVEWSFARGYRVPARKEGQLFVKIALKSLCIDDCDRGGRQVCRL